MSKANYHLGSKGLPAQLALPSSMSPDNARSKKNYNFGTYTEKRSAQNRTIEDPVELPPIQYQRTGQNSSKSPNLYSIHKRRKAKDLTSRDSLDRKLSPVENRSMD